MNSKDKKLRLALVEAGINEKRVDEYMELLKKVFGGPALTSNSKKIISMSPKQLLQKMKKEARNRKNKGI